MKVKKTFGIILTLAIIFSLCSCFNVTVTPHFSGGVSPSVDNTENNGVSFSETSAPEISESDFVTGTEPVSEVPSSEEPKSTEPSSSETASDAPKTPDQMNNEELLSFFNSSLNKVKDEKVGFKKSKLTSVADIRLSNSAANTLVGFVKDSLLSETADETTVNRGENGIDVMSPSGKTYASALTLNDISSIICNHTDTGDYVITVTVKGETNPSEGSALSKAFDYITVDDVVNIYAPKVSATVAKDDIKVVFSDCTATLHVTADGAVRSYSTFVSGVINMYNASIKKVVTINTDLAISLSSTTDYTNFAY